MYPHVSVFFCVDSKYVAFVCDEAGSSRTTHRCHVIKTGEFEVSGCPVTALPASLNVHIWFLLQVDVKVIVRTIKSTLSDSQ